MHCSTALRYGLPLGNGVERIIRLEGRAGYAKCGAPTWQIQDFHIGDSRCAVGNKITIGSHAEQAEALHVTGDAAVSGELSVNSLRASTANQLTINDNLVVHGNLQLLNGNLNGWSPFLCAGRVGEDGSVLSSKGRVGYTVNRTATGRYTISFATPASANDYVVQLTCFTFDASGGVPNTASILGNGLRTDGFDVVIEYGSQGTNWDQDFHFAVIDS